MLQLVLLFGVSNPVKRFDIGCCAGISCFVCVLVSLYRVYQEYRWAAGEVQNQHLSLLIIGELLFLLLAGICAFSLPRRPSVSYLGRPVDRQNTVSALERYIYCLW